jgi:hypothetical protein
VHYELVPRELEQKAIAANQGVVKLHRANKKAGGPIYELA